MKARLNIGIIPDGNRTYAKERSILPNKAYARGAVLATDITRHCLERGDVGEITFFLLSQDNVKNRSSTDLKILIDEIQRGLKLFQEIPDISMSCCGKYSMDLERCFQLGNRAVNNTKLKVNFLINYSPKWDLSRDPIESSAISPINIMIRTNPHTYLSGFLPVQNAYAQFYFLDCFWPEFTREKLNEVIGDYEQRWMLKVPGD